MTGATARCRPAPRHRRPRPVAGSARRETDDAAGTTTSCGRRNSNYWRDPRARQERDRAPHPPPHGRRGLAGLASWASALIAPPGPVVPSSHADQLKERHSRDCPDMALSSPLVEVLVSRFDERVVPDEGRRRVGQRRARSDRVGTPRAVSGSARGPGSTLAPWRRASFTRARRSRRPRRPGRRRSAAARPQPALCAPRSHFADGALCRSQRGSPPGSRIGASGNIRCRLPTYAYICRSGRSTSQGRQAPFSS